MTKEDYPKNHPDYILFYGEKNAENEWYTLNEKGKKIWDTQKVSDFWARLRKEKMAKEDYDFSNFIFPEFGEDNFWIKGTKKVFTKDVIFRKAIFSGRADFRNVTFSECAYFSGATFNEMTSFDGTIFENGVSFGTEVDFGDTTFESEVDFSGETDFRGATFENEAYFRNVTFSGGADFWGTTFSGLADFGSATFENEASFEGATFSGLADFGSATFRSEADFEGATFNEMAYFSSAAFKEVYFDSTTFKERAFFKYVTFESNTEFLFTLFEKQVDFSYATFESKTSFRVVEFKGQTSFISTIFKKVTDFSQVRFTDELFFEEINCIGATDIQFNNIQFSIASIVHFKSIQFIPTDKGTPTFKFNSVGFNEKVVFFKCDFECMHFTYCELTKVNISNCDLPRIRKQKVISTSFESNRIQLSNEVFNSIVYEEVKRIDSDNYEKIINQINRNKKDGFIVDPKTLLKRNNIKVSEADHYNMMASTYSQLKANYVNKRNWLDAGDNYRSEMVMRKKAIKIEIGQLWMEHKRYHYLPVLYVNLIVIRVYDILSGFQQSISRPLLWLCAVWLGFGWGYYYFDDYSMGDGLKESAKAILILSGSLQNGSLFGYMVLERVLGVILLTFFVLATRARLKQ